MVLYCLWKYLGIFKIVLCLEVERKNENGEESPMENKEAIDVDVWWHTETRREWDENWEVERLHIERSREESNNERCDESVWDCECESRNFISLTLLPSRSKMNATWDCEAKSRTHGQREERQSAKCRHARGKWWFMGLGCGARAF